MVQFDEGCLSVERGLSNCFFNSESTFVSGLVDFFFDNKSNIDIFLQYVSNYLEHKKFPTQVVIKVVPQVRYSQDFPILPPWDSQTFPREDSEIRQVIIQRIPFSLPEIR